MSRFATSAKRPMNVSIAASVAGTVAVTGTVVAVASDQPARPRLRPVANSHPISSMTSAANVRNLHDAVRAAGQEREHQLARQRIAAAKKKAAAKRAKARKRAAQRAAEARQYSTSSRSYSRVDEHMSASAAHVLEIAAAQSGDHYAYGAAGPDSFDCSGFTQYVFSKVGISLPHSASAQYGVAQHVSSPQPGDLVFVYNGGGGSIGHVAIYAGGGYWYEASNPSQPVGKHRAWSTHVSYGRVL